MGSAILEPITKVSDNQYLADMETLNNVLFDASVAALTYDNFEISDFIDTRYFYVDSDKDIKTDIGNIIFDETSQKVTWKIDNLKSGSKAKLTIKARLKTELIGAGGGRTIKLTSILENYRVSSFKINGTLITRDTFVMPAEDAIITDVVLVPCFESEHNPYSNNLNEEKEKTFDGATSLTVELDCQTQSTSYDYIYLYDSTGKQYGKYGGTTRKTETITIPGNYIKILFHTNGSSNNYYGYKATITPNYD